MVSSLEDRSGLRVRIPPGNFLEELLHVVGRHIHLRMDANRPISEYRFFISSLLGNWNLECVDPTHTKYVDLRYEQ